MVESTALEKRQAARPREFESPPLRQFSKFGFWAIVASPSLRSGSAETRILYGFLKIGGTFWTKSEPISPQILALTFDCRPTGDNPAHGSEKSADADRQSQQKFYY